MNSNISYREISTKTARFIRNDLLVLFIFPATLWVSRYLYTPSFGLYEDDYSRIPPPMAMELAELGETLLGFFTQYVGQGRPLQLTFTFSLAYFGHNIGGLPGIYALGLGVLTLNAILFYFLLKRLTNRTFAITASILFCIYSADTNQAYLTRALGVFPSITFLLLAMHAYLSGRKILTCLFAIGILTTYETPYTVMFALPFLDLEQKWDRNFAKKLMINGALLVCLLLLVFGLRVILGESRVSGLNLSDSLMKASTNMLIGPVVNLGLFIYRPIQTLSQLDRQVLSVIVGCFIFLFIFFTQIDFGQAFWRTTKDRTISGVNPSESIIGLIKSILLKFLALISENSNLLLMGLIMLALAYPLTLTVRPYAISGRTTRVHFAGLIGSTFFWATLLYIFNFLAWKFRRPLIGSFCSALLISLTIGFGIVVQKDYARAWELQQIFWRSLLDKIPYTQENLTIFIDPQGLEDTRYIDANTWSLPRVLPYIYNFKDDETGIPQVYRLIPDWREHAQVNSLELKVLNFRYELVTSRWEDTIIFETVDNQISNRLEIIKLQGERYPLNQYEYIGGPDTQPGILYNELIDSNQ